jgi:prepilin-type N-terminal cleavage/methylation domain-containing protein
MSEMNTTSRRSGFTLVEMLVVLGVIATVAAIFVPIVLNLTDRNQVSKGASMLENALSLAKARAIAEKKNCGIRLMLANANLRELASAINPKPAFAWYDEIQYIESPSDYVEHWVWGLAGNNVETVVQPFWSTVSPAAGPAAPSPGALPLGLDTVNVKAGPYTFNALVDTGTTVSSQTVARQNCLFGPISILSGANSWTSSTGVQYRSQRFAFDPLNQTPYLIQPGDRIEVTGVGELFTVVAVSSTNVDISLAPSTRVFVPIYVVDRALPQHIIVPLNGRPNYRVIRQPRTIPALAPMKLPQDVVIDLTPSRFGLLGAGADLDTTGNAWMSNVSLGINLRTVTIGATTYRGISNLTDPAAPTPLVAPMYVDILFSPSGEVLPTAQQFSLTGPNRLAGFNVGSSGLIALWLHSRGDPNLWAARQITAAQGNADNQAIVGINGRTGFIGSYPNNRTTADPLANARIGKARLSADTGQ